MMELFLPKEKNKSTAFHSDLETLQLTVKPQS